MEYRTLNETAKEKLSLLGYGCMRFPVITNEAGSKIDEERAEKLLDTAYRSGVTYFDTAYPYHDGQSEPFVGRVMKKYQRDSFYFATKLPTFRIQTLEEAKEIFVEQLSNLQTDYVDFYLLHTLNKELWEHMKKLKVIPFLEEQQRQGKIRHLGFSFHDDYPVFEEILTYRNWDFCQIQLNYMDTQLQAGLKGYELAASRNIPVIIMEPVKGGSLAKLPPDVCQPFTKAAPDRSLASWALRWVASLPNVKVVLSGMSDEEQLADNLKTFTDFSPLNETEKEAVSEVAGLLLKRIRNGCTGCRYCMPCPYGVDIPKNFSIWNEYAMYQDAQGTKDAYFHWTKEEARASNCKKCGACEKKCPQAIKIREDLDKVASEISSL